MAKAQLLLAFASAAPSDQHLAEEPVLVSLEVDLVEIFEEEGLVTVLVCDAVEDAAIAADAEHAVEE